MTRHRDLPSDAEATEINIDFLAGRANLTGFWDDHGRPAPWPHDLDDWRPATNDPTNFDF